ncbi:MAG: glycosyltransferase [Pseudomonadota bacterium]
MLDTLPTHIPARDPAAPTAIPRVIHQTFETATVPRGMARAAQSWPALNPRFHWQFHDAPARRQFIATAYGGDVLRAYDLLKDGAFKADLWRYCLLYTQGGVYADIDMVCLTDLDHVLRPGDRLVVAPDGYRPWALSNGFICAAPRNPILLAAIERATAQILKRRPRFQGWLATGPGNLGRAANSVLNRAPDARFQGGTDCGTLRLIDRANASPTMRRHFHADGHPILLTEYQEYRDDLADHGVDHWSASIPAPRLIGRLRRKLGLGALT